MKTNLQGRDVPLPTTSQFRTAVAAVTITAGFLYAYNFLPSASHILVTDWHDRLSGTPIMSRGTATAPTKITRAKRAPEGLDNLRYELHSRVAKPISMIVPGVSSHYSVSWQTYSGCLFAGFLAVFAFRNDRLAVLAGMIKRVANLERLRRTSTALSQSKLIQPIVAAVSIIRVSRKADQIITFGTWACFALVATIQLVILHYDVPSDFTNASRVLLRVMIAVSIFFGAWAVVAKRLDGLVSANRRHFVAVAGSAVVAWASIPAIETFSQWLLRGHYPHPRYRHRKPVRQHRVFAAAGLYQNQRNGRFHFVDAQGFVKSPNRIKETNLTPVRGLTEDHFPKLSRTTANAYFETWALGSIRRGKLLDVMTVLETGARYEIYRLKNNREQQPNIRILKLYAGLCYKTRNHQRLVTFRKIVRDAKLTDKLQPGNQQWLARAWNFKARWYNRSSYAGVPLPTNRS